MHNADQLIELKYQYLTAFDNWLDVPDSLFNIATAESEIKRKELILLLHRSWFKLKQDMAAVLTLINANHLGTAKAVLRMCRETSLNMLLWALSDPSRDSIHLHLIRDVRPKANAKRLKRDVKSFLDATDLKLDPRIISQLQGALHYAEMELNRPDFVSIAQFGEINQKGFGRIAELLTQTLAAECRHHAIPAQVIDYWLESEAVHTGFNSIHLYSIKEGQCPETARAILSLAILKDLYGVKAMVSMSLLHGLGLASRFQRPLSDVRLSEIARKGEEMVVGVLQYNDLENRKDQNQPNKR